ncbi:hypothetical protein [Nonomuraea rubra]|uniref:Uncharacterized protein n=1 Tax=Nonomuraea rubra TaxID=46180 RepID=A0A7X0U1J0_9ACTN|nr:hypothetical protein [Nonomuraea rubra]MBB6551731.1 hypothetical protein [Nonomuraea rubra]
MVEAATMPVADAKEPRVWLSFVQASLTDREPAAIRQAAVTEMTGLWHQVEPATP